MLSGGTPDWKIPPVREICRRNLNSAGVRKRRPLSQRNKDAKTVADNVASEDHPPNVTAESNTSDEKVSWPGIRSEGGQNPTSKANLKDASNKIRKHFLLLKCDHRPATSPCGPLSRDSKSWHLTSPEWQETLEVQNHAKDSATLSSPATSACPLTKRLADIPVKVADNVTDHPSATVPPGPLLRVPSRREGTPREERGRGSKNAQPISSVFYLNQDCGGQPQRKCIVVVADDDSDEYDTDCEPEIAPEFRPEEFMERQLKLDVDIGHLTYENLCKRYLVKPRKRVLQQLWGRKLDLRHAGLSTLDVKAIAAALAVNSRVEEVIISDSHLVSEALCDVFTSVQQNCFITQLDLSGSLLDMDAATVCCNMLTQNRWLLALNLSDCCIGDNEIEPIAQGIKENQNLENLNLSKNKISLTGGLLLGRALGLHGHLKTVNLSWNHVRGGGAVGICNSLVNNKSIEDLDLSWNGIGFEGCLALGESLRVNRCLKKLNLENNRINWDCVPYLSKSLSVNISLEVIKLGQNPISMEGCEELLISICKPSSKVNFISFAGIPINTKIALIATDIAKLRQFDLVHGGIFSSNHVLGEPKVPQGDPFSLLVRYMSAMKIRVMDLFRIFDKDNQLCVTRERFIQGLKRVRVPLDDKEILRVAKQLQLSKHGNISYQELATLVRNRIRDDRLEDKKQIILQKKKQEERKRILQSDKPLNAPSQMNFLPGLYNMYSARDKDSQRNIYTPASGGYSRPSSIYTPLPAIKTRNRGVDEITFGRRTPMTLVRQNAFLLAESSPVHSSHKMTDDSQRFSKGPGMNDTSYVSQMKWQQFNPDLLTRKQSFL